jgi:hypothetical protein
LHFTILWYFSYISIKFFQKKERIEIHYIGSALHPSPQKYKTKTATLREISFDIALYLSIRGEEPTNELCKIYVESCVGAD